jgi:hypothetical protein
MLLFDGILNSCGRFTRISEWPEPGHHLGAAQGFSWQ